MIILGKLMLWNSMQKERDREEEGREGGKEKQEGGRN